MTDGNTQQSTECKVCDSILKSTDNYCANCGSASDAQRPGLGAQFWVLWDTFRRSVMLIVIASVFVCLLLVFQALYFWYVSSRYGAVQDAGVFGDQFGALTAFFTGAGFVALIIAVFPQLEDLRRHSEEQKKSQDSLTATTSMGVLNTMEERFGHPRMLKVRRQASARLIQAYIKEPDVPQSQERDSKEIEWYLRDVLNFFERLAHFTNHRDIEKDTVLNAFHMRMKMYYKLACIYCNVEGERKTQPLLWQELEDLINDASLKEWHDEDAEAHGKLRLSEGDLATMYAPDYLCARLKGEYVRCGGNQEDFARWEKELTAND